MTETNWAGNLTYSGEVIRPETIEGLQQAVARASSVRAISTRHSFCDIADADLVVDLGELPATIDIDTERNLARVGGLVSYGMLIPALAEHDLALHNLASLPHISVAGAIATGTHGSGDTNGNLATAVSGLEFLLASGDLIEVDRTHPDFDGMVVSLGALGIVTAVTLDLEPASQFSQVVFEDIPLDTWTASFDHVSAAGYSVSGFTRWADVVEQTWVKSRSGSEPAPGTLLDVAPCGEDRHVIRELSPESCTPQRGSIGSWAHRLPHFKLDFTPSAGEEIQSEFFIDRADLPGASAALRDAEPDLRRALQMSEVRTVAADQLWMSPNYGRDSVAFHFTWQLDSALADAAASTVWEALAPFDPRPHWGKVAPFGPDMLRSFERAGDFSALADRLDPGGTFRNDWFRRLFG